MGQHGTGAGARSELLGRAAHALARAAAVLAVTAMVAAGLAAPASAASRPGAPSVTTRPGNGTLSVIWKAPTSGGSPITKYQAGVRRYLPAKKAWGAWSYRTLGPSARSTSYSYPNGTRVQARVRATNAIGTGAWSSTLTTVVGLPSAVPGVTAAPRAGSLRVTWSAASGNGSTITGYRVYTRSLVGSTWSAWSSVLVAASARSRTVTGLVDGRTHQVRVRAVNRWGLGPIGSTVSAVPGDFVAPGPVSGLSVTGTTSTSVSLSWTNPVDADLASVVVRRSTGAAPATVADGTGSTLSPAPTSTTVTGLSGSTTYWFSVFALDAAGNVSAKASVSAATKAAGGLAIASSDANGVPGSLGASHPALSPDGTKVAFSSYDSLVPADTSNAIDLYVKDLVTGSVQLVSRSLDGGAGDGESSGAEWSPDGTRIAFESRATNLIGVDTNSAGDVFVATLATGAIQRVSEGEGGLQSTGVQVQSKFPEWSPDGTRIAFMSTAANWVAGDTLETADLFIKTLSTGSITRATSGGPGSAADARGNPVWSPDGSRIAFLTGAALGAGDDEGREDLYAYAVETGTFTRLTEGPSSAGINAGFDDWSWSPDGTRVVFESTATNLGGGVNGNGSGGFDVFVSSGPGTVRMLSADSDGDGGNSWSGDPSWTPSGTVVFASASTDLVKGSSLPLGQVYEADAGSGELTVLTRPTPSTYATGGETFEPQVSADGSRLLFVSGATNLVSGDTEGRQDLFVLHLASGSFTRITQTAGGKGFLYGAQSYSIRWAPSSDRIAFISSSSIDDGGNSYVPNLYVWTG